MFRHIITHSGFFVTAYYSCISYLNIHQPEIQHDTVASRSGSLVLDLRIWKTLSEPHLERVCAIFTRANTQM